MAKQPEKTAAQKKAIADKIEREERAELAKLRERQAEPAAPKRGGGRAAASRRTGAQRRGKRFSELETKYKGTATPTAAKTTAAKTTAAKANGKTESFKTWWDRQYDEKGEGAKADWTDPKTGKTRSILLTHDKSKLKPKSKSLLSKAGDAIKSVIKETPAATKKIRAKYQTSGPGTKRGARQRSRMNKELRDSKGLEYAKNISSLQKETEAARLAAEKAAAAKKAAVAKPPTAPERKKSKNPLVPETWFGLNKGGSVKKSGYAHGGKVRGVGIAKRGHGRGRSV